MIDVKTAEPLLEVEGLSRSYQVGATVLPVLKDVCLKLAAGETVAIVGASGSGKSTLLHVVGGLDQPTGGQVSFREKDIYGMTSRQRTAFRARSVGFIFQFYHLLPELDVLENVMLPAMNSSLGLFGFAYPAEKGVPPTVGPHSLCGRGSCASTAGQCCPALPEERLPKSEKPDSFLQDTPRDRALSLLQSVGLAERADHLPGELSGGEQQRAAVARALINDPELILADEPTGNLDSVTGAQVLNVLFGLVRDYRRTMLMVTHNAEVAARCDRTLKLQDGILSPL